MDRKYNLRLDLQFRCNNSTMKFRQSDNKTSDFFMRVTSGGELFNIDNAIVILAVIKPKQTVQSQFLEIKEGKIYADLNANMKDQIGPYKAQALLIYEDERVSTDVIEYEVTEDNILNQLETTVSTTEEFTMLQQMLSRLSTVENAESLRNQAEINRVEAEKLREEAIEKIKSDTTKLITDTKKEITDYKNAKDTAINDDFVKYKEATNKSIENYKNAKDTEINNSLGEYKTNTTDDIEEFKNTKSQELDDFKNTKNSEIDNYKREKDLAINQYVENKNLELNEYVTEKNSEIDAYKTSKDKEIDLYKENKDTLINNKIKEVESAKQNIISTANNKISELDQAKTNMQNDVNSKLEEADNRITELQNFETQLEQIENKNNQQDNRLKDVEYKNKVQDVFVNGLFNENKDGRLSVEGEGNSLKLEGSKKGLVTVDKVVGNTSNNLCINPSITNTEYVNFDGEYYTLKANTNNYAVINIPLSYNLKANTTYTVVIPCFATTEGVSCNTTFYNTDSYVMTSNANMIANVYKLTTDTTGLSNSLRFVCNQVDGIIKFSKPMVFEGDYTNKPIPSEYFEGIQSTFEECKVTQEMIESGEELAENLGKYKCNVKIRGKNKFNAKLENGSIINGEPTTGGYREWLRTKDYIDITIFGDVSNFTVSYSKSLNIVNARLWFYDSSYNYISQKNITEPRPSNAKYMRIGLQIGTDSSVLANPNVDYNIQLEEGTQATPYEPYFSRTQTVYLNSPLLKGDEIVAKEDGLYHYHYRNIKTFQGKDEEGWFKYNIASSAVDTFAMYTTITDMYYTGSADIINDVICDKLQTYQVSSIYSGKIGIAGGGSYNRIYISTPITNAENLDQYKACLQSDPITVNYKLKEPYFEKISDDKLLLEIPNSATLSVESVIPCTSISASYTGGIPSVYGLEETNKNQDDLIDISLMATDEMYMMIEPLLSAVTINERMVSKMVDMYVAMVIRGLKTIEEVPVRYRKEVQAMLDKLEK